MKRSTNVRIGSELILIDETFYVRSSKIRRYDDIDVTKEFEKKYTHYMNTKLAELEAYYKKNAKNLIDSSRTPGLIDSSAAHPPVQLTALPASDLEDVKRYALITGFQ